MPHLFLTITLDNRDKRLINFLKKYSHLPDPTPEKEPILTSVWYAKMINIMLDAITGREENYLSPLFGKIKSFFARLEDQLLRATSHHHILIALQN
jgi:hypothetical protein